MNHFGIILASFWDHFEIILASFWDHFEIILGSFQAQPREIQGHSRVLGGRQDHVHKVPTLFVHQVGQIWSYRALVKAFESSPRDLAIRHGLRAYFLKNKRTKLDFHGFWG